MYLLVRLGDGNAPTYEDLLASWRAETEAFGEDFDAYSAIPFGVFQQIQEMDKASTALYAVQDTADKSLAAVCMVNHALIPGYPSPVLRVRHILLSPKFDFSEVGPTDYSRVLIAILAGAHVLSDEKLQAKYIKFHARSPADMQFFALLGNELGGSEMYKSVQVKGAWLYIEKH